MWHTLYDRRVVTCQSRQVDLTDWPGQVSLYKTERTWQQHGTAASGELWTRLLGETAGTGQLGQGSWDRTAGTGQLGQDSLDRAAGKERRDRSARTKQPEKTVGIVQPG